MVAVMSRKTSSSAPCCAYSAPNSTGSPASLIFSKLTPFTVRPSLISRQGMIRLVNIIPIVLLNHPVFNRYFFKKHPPSILPPQKKKHHPPHSPRHWR